MINTMGEIMLRLTPPGNLRFEQSSYFDIFYGGDEANVAVSLSLFGLDVAYITKLPKNPFGEEALNQLRRYGVNTEYIQRGGKRIGINFYEIGAAMRPSRVVYDRSNSSISEAGVEDFDFDRIFKGSEWFHTSGITPALSDRSAKLTKKAMGKAKELGLTVSMDLNYRKNLWTSEKAQSVMTDLMQYVDICIGNEEDAEKALGFKPKDTDVYKGKLDLEGYKEIFKEMQKKFGLKIIGTTLRESYSASDNGWSAIIYDGKEFYLSKKYNIHIVDRGGGGCAFAAGLIYGFVKKMNPDEIVEFATAASALKQTILGDINLVSVEEVLNLTRGDISGRIQR
jgi:2-dehydro-3-deoxygluconokinase